jgi:hypothetical protein
MKPPNLKKARSKNTVRIIFGDICIIRNAEGIGCKVIYDDRVPPKRETERPERGGPC